MARRMIKNEIIESGSEDAFGHGDDEAGDDGDEKGGDGVLVKWEEEGDEEADQEDGEGAFD